MWVISSLLGTSMFGGVRAPLDYVSLDPPTFFERPAFMFLGVRPESIRRLESLFVFVFV